MDNEEKNNKNNATTPITNALHNIHCLTIIGQIEGHNILPQNNKTTRYEDVLPTLINIEENKDIEGLLILLNTVGGDVEAGLAIAEMISGMSKPTVSIVLGGGHSIGVPLAVASKKSFIVILLTSASLTMSSEKLSLYHTIFPYLSHITAGRGNWDIAPVLPESKALLRATTYFFVAFNDKAE